MNSSATQASSSSTSFAGVPPIVARVMSGYCVAEWLPQIATLWISVIGVAVLEESCASARL